MGKGRKIVGIAFYPDYSSSGIWVTTNSPKHPVLNIEPESLPFTLAKPLKPLIAKMNALFEGTNIWRIGPTRYLNGEIARLTWLSSEEDRQRDNALLAQVRTLKKEIERMFMIEHPEEARMLSTTPCEYLEDVPESSVMIPALESIEFFPDFCSTGIWGTYEGMTHHVNVEAEDLPVKLSEDMLAKIARMQKLLDGTSPFDDPMSEEDEAAFKEIERLEKEVAEQFKREHPDHAHLLKERND